MENQNQTQIVRIPLGKANAYFVVSGRQVLLVDTGEKRKEKGILRSLKTLGFSPGDMRLIILTHTHYDHCGSLKSLKEMTGAKIAVHESEASCLREGYGGFPKGTTRVTKAISWIGGRIG